MSQIEQLIRLYQSGNGIKPIARILGMSKNTVKSYLIKMADGSFNTEELKRTGVTKLLLWQEYIESDTTGL